MLIKKDDFNNHTCYHFDDTMRVNDIHFRDEKFIR